MSASAEPCLGCGLHFGLCGAAATTRNFAQSETPNRTPTAAGRYQQSVSDSVFAATDTYFDGPDASNPRVYFTAPAAAMAGCGTDCGGLGSI